MENKLAVETSAPFQSRRVGASELRAICERADAELKRQILAGEPPEDWCGWQYDAKRIVLEYRADGPNTLYEVDPELIKTEHDTLFWIMHVSNKCWCYSQCIAGLVEAFKDLTRLGVYKIPGAHVW